MHFEATGASLEPLRLHTPRGGQVAAQLFEPPAGMPVGGQVVIGPAMGVPQRF